MEGAPWKESLTFLCDIQGLAGADTPPVDLACGDAYADPVCLAPGPARLPSKRVVSAQGGGGGQRGTICVQMHNDRGQCMVDKTCVSRCTQTYAYIHT